MGCLWGDEGRFFFHSSMGRILTWFCAGSHVTRFIGLAEFGNASKQKSLHALGIQPAAEMEPSALQQKPAGSTPCPYTAAQKRPVDDTLRGQVNYLPKQSNHSVLRHGISSTCTERC